MLQPRRSWLRVAMLQDDIDKGVPRNAVSCPVANALTRRFGGTWVVCGGFAKRANKGYRLQDVLVFQTLFDAKQSVKPIIFKVKADDDD